MKPIESLSLRRDARKWRNGLNFFSLNARSSFLEAVGVTVEEGVADADAEADGGGGAAAASIPWG